MREQWPSSSSASVRRTLSARWDSLRDTCEAVSRLHGTVARAAAENRNDDDVSRLRSRLHAYRVAESGLQSQKTDELLHIAISDAAANETLRTVLFELESRVSLGAPAHLWGSQEGMRAMELRALADHQNLIDAICDQRADDASSIAREHARIDLELLEAALRRSGRTDEMRFPGDESAT